MITKEYIQSLINQDVGSEVKRLARVGQNYYDVEHDILKYRLFYFNEDGNLEEDKLRSNLRIPHGFFTELVDQKVQYMLSDFYITSSIPELDEQLQDYFDADFVAELSECLTGASIKGFDYMYTYTDDSGKTRFGYADAFGVIEVPAKQSPDGEDHVIYWYEDVYGIKQKKIKRVECWDKEKRYYYMIDENQVIMPDPFVQFQERPHLLYKKDGRYFTQISPKDYVPFFRLDNNKRRTSDLKPIKGLIDDYDLMNCGLSNSIQDMGDGFIAVKGFEGQSLDELYKNIHGKKTIGVGSKGDVEIRTVDIPYQARKAKLEEDEKNIYRFGMGFNSALVGDGNVTNIVLKSRYVLLDLKCNKFEKQVQKLLRQFITIVLEEINQENNTACTQQDVELHMDRVVMTNALDNAQIAQIEAQTEQTKVNTLLSTAQALNNSDEVIKALCEVLELDYSIVKEGLPEDDNWFQSAQDTAEHIEPEEEVITEA